MYWNSRGHPKLKSFSLGGTHYLFYYGKLLLLTRAYLFRDRPMNPKIDSTKPAAWQMCMLWSGRLWMAIVPNNYYMTAVNPLV